MRVHETIKDGVGTRGIVHMSIKGKAEEVRKVEAILSADFENDLVDDEDPDGTLEVGFFIDRNEKADFLAAYRAAKQSNNIK